MHQYWRVLLTGTADCCPPRVRWACRWRIQRRSCDCHLQRCHRRQVGVPHGWHVAPMVTQAWPRLWATAISRVCPDLSWSQPNRGQGHATVDRVGPGHRGGLLAGCSGSQPAAIAPTSPPPPTANTTSLSGTYVSVGHDTFTDQVFLEALRITQSGPNQFYGHSRKHSGQPTVLRTHIARALNRCRKSSSATSLMPFYDDPYTLVCAPGNCIKMV